MLVGVFKIFGPLPGPPSAGPPFPCTALPGTAQNFTLFFPSPAAKFVLFFPLWVSSGGPPDRAARELQTCTSERPGTSNTTKIPREDNQRGKKRTNFAAGEGKKRAKFWAPTLRGSTLRGSTTTPHHTTPHTTTTPHHTPHHTTPW